MAMDDKTLLKRIAYLEFVNDQLQSELRYVDQLLRLIGFPEGLKTVREAAEEVIEERRESDEGL